MELRLCDYLRTQAPHIFEREKASSLDSRSTTNTNSRRRNRHERERGGSRDKESSSAPRENQQKNREPRPPSKVIWKGQITRNGGKHMSVAAVAISGKWEEILTKELTLINITHRLKYDEASKSEPLAVFYIRPEHSRETEAIDEYIHYFQEKERMGVATVNELSVYICAPGAELFERYATNVKISSIMVCVVMPASSTPVATNCPSPTKPSQAQAPAEGQNWLCQLNQITSMLGAQ